jgi:Rod binding domain-containing protein
MSDLLGSSMPAMAEQQMLSRGNNSHSSVLKNRTLLDQLRSGNRGTDEAATRQALRDAATEFEGVFMNQLVSAMRKTVGESELLPKGQGEKMFEGMLDEEWARNLSGRHGPSGLSEMIYRQLSRQMGLEEEVAIGNTILPTGESLRLEPAHPLLTLPTAQMPIGLNVEEK